MTGNVSTEKKHIDNNAFVNKPFFYFLCFVFPRTKSETRFYDASVLGRGGGGTDEEELFPAPGATSRRRIDTAKAHVPRNAPQLAAPAAGSPLRRGGSGGD